jgi:integrase
MLTIRDRGGKKKRLYIGGTVDTARGTVTVPEYSARTSDPTIAETKRAQKVLEIQAGNDEELRKRSVALGPTVVGFINAKRRAASDVSRAEKMLEFWGVDKAMAEIDATEFGMMCESKLAGLTKSTWRRYRTTLRMLFRCAGVPLPKIDTVRGKRRAIKSALEMEMANALIAAYTPHVRPIAQFARHTGIRTSEQVALLRQDVDLKGKRVLIRDPKNGNDRWVPLDEDAYAIAVLKCQGLKGSDNVFRREDGVPYGGHKTKRNPWSRAHQRARKLAGVPKFRWHDWRHHWATWLARSKDCGGAGLEIGVLKDWGGWSSLAQVAVYYEASEANAQTVLAAINHG